MESLEERAYQVSGGLLTSFDEMITSGKVLGGVEKWSE